jgi:hypothetical protein
MMQVIGSGCQCRLFPVWPFIISWVAMHPALGNPNARKPVAKRGGVELLGIFS